MWCAAPRWPQHANHLAVEFVHPVVVGKRALPAVALTAGDLVDSLRLHGRDGLLSEIVETGLRREDLAVLVQSQVPPNDGGISVGQAAIAALAEADPR
jgi:hydrogenase maturation factor HypF (carbamoyltransferase family)